MYDFILYNIYLFIYYFFIIKNIIFYQAFTGVIINLFRIYR